MCMPLLLAAALLAAGDEPQPKGRLFIIGGGTNTLEIRQRALDLAGGPKAHVVIVPNASSNIEITTRDSAERFGQAGATDVEVADLTKPEPAVSAILKADLIWISGGNQNRLTELMREAPALPEAIRRRYREGAVVAGTSAGAAIMTGLMMTGVADLDNLRVGTTQLVDGLGLWNEAIVDQHFVRRARLQRLMSAVMEHPELLGVGIDESTAVVVTGRQFEVAGLSNVVVVDARQSSRPRVGNKGEPASIANLSLHVLTAGMRYDLDKGVVAGPAGPAAGGGQ